MGTFAEEMKKRREKKASNCLSPCAKFCPFMSTPDKKVSCDPSCRLYRDGKNSKFTCPMQEFPTMSWHLKILCGFDEKSKY